ncbi:MAG: HAMP domain-containing sensor histidine kinase [Hydrogenophaga sp.]|nr:HAMP domain-containing histidine kinase [Gammaproteobacteria bacterium]
MARSTSIASKIIWGYSAIGAAIVLIAVATVLELQRLEAWVSAGERVSHFLNDTLEMRRFEKNYFLYRQRSDQEQGLAYADAALAALAGHAEDFARVAGDQELQRLQNGLHRYRALLASAGRDSDETPLADQIRQEGKWIATRAEEMGAAERRMVQQSLAASRTRLLAGVALLAVFGIITARILSNLVVRPLYQLQAGMQRVAQGGVHRIHIDSRQKEIRSLTAAFNRMMEDLESQQAHLVRSQKLASLGTLLSGVAHELNNPLSNLSTTCQILMEEFEDMDPQARREMLAQIDEQTERTRRIVQTLLEFARERRFRRERVEFLDLAQGVLQLVRGQMPSGIAVRLDIEPGLQIHADKQRLQQALINLLKNAQQAMGAKGEIRMTAAVAHQDAPHPGNCPPGTAMELTVSDTGAGIPADILPRVFDPFFTTKAVGHGSGLGLAIVHEIIAEHDGCISVNSTPGTGTTFHIRLPLAMPPAGEHA